MKKASAGAFQFSSPNVVRPLIAARIMRMKTIAAATLMALKRRENSCACRCNPACPAKGAIAYTLMMLSVIMTGVPGVSLRAGSCSTPQKTATSHPRRQSTSAMVIDRTRKAAKMMVIIAGSGCGTPRGGPSFRIRDHPPAGAGQSPRQQQPADLAGELRRDGPRMRQVKPRDDVGAQPAQGVAPERRPM